MIRTILLIGIPIIAALNLSGVLAAYIKADPKAEEIHRGVNGMLLMFLFGMFLVGNQ